AITGQIDPRLAAGHQRHHRIPRRASERTRPGAAKRLLRGDALLPYRRAVRRTFAVRLQPAASAPAERRPAVGPVRPQRATGALSGATLAAGARRRAVLRNAQPTAVLRRYAGLAGEQRMARSAVAVQRRAIAGPTRAAHLDALRGPQRLAAGSGAVAAPPVPGAPGQLPGVLQQFRLPAAGQRHAGRTASGPAVLGAGARHG